MFNVIFKYITANLSSNKNDKLNTIFENHDKLGLGYEYFHKWIIEQAITFKTQARTISHLQNLCKYFHFSQIRLYVSFLSHLTIWTSQ